MYACMYINVSIYRYTSHCFDAYLKRKTEKEKEREIYTKKVNSHQFTTEVTYDVIIYLS